MGGVDESISILLVEDSPSDAALVRAHLERSGHEFRVDWAVSLAEGSQRLERAACTVLDLTLPGLDGLAELAAFVTRVPDMPIVVLTGYDDELGVEAVRAGAQDYLRKDDLNPAELQRAVRHAIERKHSEVELRRLSAELHTRGTALARSSSTIFDESATGMLQVDAGGTIVAANRAATQLVGATGPGALVGTDVARLFSDAGTPHSEQARDADERPSGSPLTDLISEMTSLGGARQAHATLQRRDGSTRLTKISLLHLLMQADGHPVVLLTIDDVTAERSSLLRRAHDQKLEELGRLAAGLAHEIRSPLQYVTTSLEYARQTLPTLVGHDQAPPTPDAAERTADVFEALDEVAEGIGRITDIVDGMNVLAHTPQTTDAETTDLNQCLRFPLAVARGQAPADTTIAVREGDPGLVAMPASLIQQAILNLMVNAVHALEDRAGTEGVHGGEILINTRASGGHGEVRVSDNGIGMQPDVLARATEPFFTTKDTGRGTGQGLALTRELVEQHGGTLDIESEAGVGTNVTIRIPLAPSRPNESGR